MKTEIPEELKKDVPPTIWGKVLLATPVVMTIVATLLAALAQGEMTKAQYDRALAAQQQSKAGDQWGFFQAKRLRSAVQLGTLDVVEATVADHRPDADGLRALAATLSDPAAVRTALDFLLAGRLPEAAGAPPAPGPVQAALDAVEQGRPEPELARILNAVTPEAIAASLRTAQDRARAFDDTLRPIISAGDRLGDVLEPTTTEHRALSKEFTVLRLRYSALRYDAEARLNQAIANLHELQVRQSNLSAERHYRRSQWFFDGMLAAQAAVIIATFAIAARKRNFLWTVAATAGLGAVSFAAYVYLFL
ncbi:MAG TPA: DUF4337 family protein [Opitutaceae bacterium]|nr:DUF4337 family protein [Opitutaceae bacterium]